MELVFYPQAPEQALTEIPFNYEELKAWCEEGLKKYDGRVYTEGDIPQAKKDRAILNKLANALDDARKEKKAQYLAPVNAFEAKVKEIVALVKKRVDGIDTQIKEYDEERKREKQEEITAIYAAKIGDLANLVPYEKLHNPKWLNATASMATVEQELTDKIKSISEGLAVIDRLNIDADVLLMAKAEYLINFDISAALATADYVTKQREALKQREAEKKAQAEAKKAQEATANKAAQPEYSAPTASVEVDGGINTPQTEEVAVCVDFRVYATRAQLEKLKAFMKENGIKYGRVTAE